MLRTLWVTHKFTPLHIRMLLAKYFLLPTMLYGSEIYACCGSMDKLKLNKLLNTITRLAALVVQFGAVRQFSVGLRPVYGLCQQASNA